MEKLQLNRVAYTKSNNFMDWICFIFKKGKHVYMVADESIDAAWKSLANRQSMSVDNCKKQYTFVQVVNTNSGVVKI